MAIMDGSLLSKIKFQELKENISKLDRKPGLAVIQVGDDAASNIYVQQKRKKALELDYKFIYKQFDINATEEEIIKVIMELNQDTTIDGIIVQLPLPIHLIAANIQNSIIPSKDVDGLHEINRQNLTSTDSFIPCTPKGILQLIDYYNVEVENKEVAVIGKSNLVGKPVATLLQHRGANVTICDSKTKNIENITKMSDIIIIAIGKANYIKKNMIKDNVVIIDVGINKDQNGRLCGDVDFNDVYDKCFLITPVPGGVGPMTIYNLFENVYLAYMKDMIK